MNLENIYKGKKVFLTGHTGFKGSWLLSWLHYLGAEIKGYALEPENQYDLYNNIKGDELCKSVIADIRDKERLQNEIISFQPDFIFHLAAQPLVRLSYQMADHTFEINAMGTAYVLEAIKDLQKPCVAVFITTDKVYFNRETDYAYKEEDPLGGHDPYSASKACAELIIDSYRNSFFSPEKYVNHQKSISSARAGNVIGGGDWAKDRIIPDIIRAVCKNLPISVRNPNSVRPWQHVLEPLHGYLVLGAVQCNQPTMFAEAYNFGPRTEDVLTVGQLVNIALNHWGSGKMINENSPQTLHEAGLLKLDISKATNKLPWRPKWDATQGIQTTVSFYKDFLINKVDASELVKKQIMGYCNF